MMQVLTAINREWWWFHVSRKLTQEYMCRAVAMRLPRGVAYWAFVRVFANTEPYDHMEAFKVVGDRWLNNPSPGGGA